MGAVLEGTEVAGVGARVAVAAQAGATRVSALVLGLGIGLVGPSGF